MTYLQHKYFVGSFILLSIIGYFLYAQFADYTYLSSRHVSDIFRANIWGMGALLIFVGIVYWKRDKSYTPALSVMLSSVFFLVLYSYIFRGTEYGMNGYWGDNGYRLAMVCKMMTTFTFPDAYLKGLPSLYPPLWFYGTAMIAKLLSLEAYQTVKFGYFIIFLLYPWAIYFSWKPLAGKILAAVISVATIFLSYDLLPIVFYEHVSLALFVPWWLRFFERVDESEKITIAFYAKGILVGSLIFLTYYWWFFMAVAALPITLIISIRKKCGRHKLIEELKRKLIVGTGIVVGTSVFWLPLLLAAINNGYSSTQSNWFRIGYTDINHYLFKNPQISLIVLSGIFSLFYLWRHPRFAKIGVLIGCGFVVILLDRFLNLGWMSIQSRKFVEFLPLILLIPVLLSIEKPLEKIKKMSSSVKNGMIGVLILLLLFYANAHTMLYENIKMKHAINCRNPATQIEVLKPYIDNDDVLLTDKYIETVFIPYNMFIPINNTSANIAGNYKDRLRLLELLEQVTEPDIFAYACVHNRFDTIDYIYLPTVANTDSVYLPVNSIPFNSRMIQDSLFFVRSMFDDTVYFEKLHRWGLYKVKYTGSEETFLERVSKTHPELLKEYFSLFRHNAPLLY